MNRSEVDNRVTTLIHNESLSLEDRTALAIIKDLVQNFEPKANKWDQIKAFYKKSVKIIDDKKEPEINVIKRVYDKLSTMTGWL